MRALPLAQALGVRAARLGARHGGDATQTARRLGATCCRSERGAVWPGPMSALLVIDDPSRAAARRGCARRGGRGALVASLHDLGIAPLRPTWPIDGSLGARRVARPRRRRRVCRLGTAYAVLDRSLGCAARPPARTRRVGARATVAASGWAAGSRPGRLEHCPNLRARLDRVRAEPGTSLAESRAGFIAPIPRWPRCHPASSVDSAGALSRDAGRARRWRCVAGGATLYEACALGTPVVAVAVVPGQATTVRRFGAGRVVAAGVAERRRRAATRRVAARAAACGRARSAGRRRRRRRRLVAPRHGSAVDGRGRRAAVRARPIARGCGGARASDADEGTDAERLTTMTRSGQRDAGRRQRRCGSGRAPSGRGGAAVRHRRDRPQPRRLARPRAGARRRRGARRRVSASSCSRCAPRRLVAPMRAGAAARARGRAVAARLLRALRARRGGASPPSPQRARAHGLGLHLHALRRSRRRHAGPRSTCDAYKIASGDLTHHRLIARAAATGKPLVISTGLSHARRSGRGGGLRARSAARGSLALLHCVSAYPAPDDQQNLGAIRTLATVFGLPVGLSDHSARRRRRRRRGGARRLHLRAARQGRRTPTRDRRGGVVDAGRARRGSSRPRARDAARLGTGRRDAAGGGAARNRRRQPPRALCARAISPPATVDHRRTTSSRCGPRDGAASVPLARALARHARPVAGDRVPGEAFVDADLPCGRSRETRLARLNVLITAASRRVALVQAFQRALRRPGISRRGHRLRRQPAVARGAHRRPRLRGAVLRRPGLPRRDPRDLRTPPASARRPDHRRRAAALRGARATASKPLGIARRRLAARHRAATCNDKCATCRHAARRRASPAATTWLPRRRCRRRRRFPLFVKPRGGRGSVQAFPADDAVELAFFLRYVADAGRPGVSATARSSRSTCSAISTGEPLSVVPRERVVIRAGVIDRGRHRRTIRALIAPGAGVRAGLQLCRSRSTSSAAIVDGRPRCSRSTRASRAASR